MFKVKRWLTHCSWLRNHFQKTNHEAAATISLPRWRLSFCCSSLGAGDKAKSNTMRSQKRAVLNMAFGYSMAWLLVWIPFIISNFLLKSRSPHMAFLTPLQGFYNFVVFMAPKVRTTRMMAMRRARSSNNMNQNQQHLTWRQAFYKAYMDRGRSID